MDEFSMEVYHGGKLLNNPIRYEGVAIIILMAMNMIVGLPKNWEIWLGSWGIWVMVNCGIG